MDRSYPDFAIFFTNSAKRLDALKLSGIFPATKNQGGGRMTILNEPTKNRRSNYLRQTGLLAAVPGLLIAGPLVGYFIGQWADSYFATAPWLLILGIAFGFAAAGREIWRLVKKAEKYSQEDDQLSGHPSSTEILLNDPLNPHTKAEKKKDFPGHDPEQP